MARSRTPSVNAIQASGPRMMTTRQQKQPRDHPHKFACSPLRAVQRAQERLALKGENADLYAEAADGVLALYRNRLEGRRRTADRSSQGRRLAEAEQRLWLAGLRAEREEIFKQARSRRIDDQTARKLVRELDLLEARIVH